MHRILLLVAALAALPSWAASLTTTSCGTTTAAGCLVVPMSQYANARGVAVQVSGTWTGALVFEVSNTSAEDSYTAVLAVPTSGGPFVTGTETNGAWFVPAGFSYFRVRASSMSGTATVTAQPTASEPPTSTVRAVGTSGPVEVALDSTSTAALTAPTCTHAITPPVLTLTTTAQDVPTTPLAGRTQELLINNSSTQRVWCCIGTACTPTSTAAYVLLPNGGSRSVLLRDSVPVRCRSVAATAELSVEESSCG